MRTLAIFLTAVIPLVALIGSDELKLGDKNPLSIQEVGWVNKNTLILKITNKSNEVIMIPLESGFPDYNKLSNCLILKVKKGDGEKENVYGAKPLQSELVVQPLSSAVAIIQVAKNSLELQMHDEVEVQLDNTYVAVGLGGLKKNEIYKGILRSRKVELLNGVSP